MKEIILGKPYLKKDKEKIKLLVDVLRTDKERFSLFFEYEVEYEKYICLDVLDPFLTAILPYALENGYNVICNYPITDEIYYNYTYDLIPVFVANQDYFTDIQIIPNAGIIQRMITNNTGVGTGVSCGVDSLYTILFHSQGAMCQAHKLTHLVLMNAGSCSWKGGAESYEWFSKEANEALKVCDSLNLKLVTINTNLMEFYACNHSHSGTMRMAGCVQSLDKLFGKYYLASGYDIGKFQFANDDAAYAFYTLRYASTNNINFYLTGNSVNRDSRVSYISDSMLAHNYLNVCWNGFPNCGKCEKCLRTIGSLYSIGKLEEFTKVFDVKAFYDKKKLNIARMLYNSRNHRELYGFLKIMKKNNRKEYYSAKFLEILAVYPFELAKKMFNTIIPQDSDINKHLKITIKRIIKR